MISARGIVFLCGTTILVICFVLNYIIKGTYFTTSKGSKNFLLVTTMGTVVLLGLLIFVIGVMRGFISQGMERIEISDETDLYTSSGEGGRV